MSTVEEIEKAIGSLPRKEFWKLTDKLIARREAAWDAQIEVDAASGSLDALWSEAEKEIDAASGSLDALWSEAEKEIDAGETQPLDAFLGHQKI